MKFLSSALILFSLFGGTIAQQQLRGPSNQRALTVDDEHPSQGRELGDSWKGNDGELCLPIAQIHLCDNLQEVDDGQGGKEIRCTNYNKVLGYCGDCKSKTYSWWHGGVPGYKCGMEAAGWPDQTVCAPDISCHLCKNGHHREGVLEFCGPDRNCKPAGESVTWFGAHLCCNGHTVHFGYITCN